MVVYWADFSRTMVENKKISLELISLEEMEGRSEQDWTRVIVKWHPMTRAFANILISVSPEQRASITEGLSDMGTDSDEPDMMVYFTHLAALSPAAIDKIKKVLSTIPED